MKYRLHDKEFSTKTSLQDYIRSILYQPLTDESRQILFSLIKYHPHYLEKTLISVKDFEVVANPKLPKARELYLIHQNDTRTNISWCNCIKNIPSRGEFQFFPLYEASMRSLEDVYIGILSNEDFNQCEICEMSMIQDERTIYFKEDFRKMVDTFFQTRSPPKNYKRVHQHVYMEDEELETEWREWSMRNSQIGICCKECLSNRYKTFSNDSGMTI